MVKHRWAIGEWVDYDRKDRKTWTPPNEIVQVMIRTSYKNEDGTTFFYCPTAMRIAPAKMRNLCIPEGRKGSYFDVCRVLRWRYI